MLLDRYSVWQATTLLKSVTQWYNQYSFASIVQALARYCSVELSAHYLDMSKDRLYVEHAQGVARRSAQTAQYYILTMLNQMIAPLIPFTAEDVFLAKPYAATERSVHLQRFMTLKAPIIGEPALWEMLGQLREKVLQEIEKLRATGSIKHSLEAALYFNDFSGSDYEALCGMLVKVLGSQTIESFFKEWFIVSQCFLSVDLGTSDLFVSVRPAQGIKCPRCWHWFLMEEAHQELCSRCSQVIQK